MLNLTTLLTGWRQELKKAITCLSELSRYLELDEQALKNMCVEHADFSLKVSRPFIKKMQKRNLNDPLLKQVLPLKEELVSDVKYDHEDPLQEMDYNPVPGLIHKYKRRALVILGGSCAIHCRYCFRRHFPYDLNAVTMPNQTKIKDYLLAHPEIDEIIFSGGDPLMLGMSKLKMIGELMNGCPQVKRLRIHTRLPVLIPNCIDDALIDWIQNQSQKMVMVIHVNHAQEIDEAVKGSASRLLQAGVTVLNQAVLLKGVNDSVKALVDLSTALFEAGILPYYLNLLDPVKGARHFNVDLVMAQNLLFEVSSLLPGYLVPRLVVEKPGYPFKKPIPPERQERHRIGLANL